MCCGFITGCADIAELLLQHGEDLEVNVKNEDGDITLMCSCAKAFIDLDIVKLVLRYDADVNIRNNDVRWPGRSSTYTVCDPKTNVLQSCGPMPYGPRVLCPMVLYPMVILSYVLWPYCLMSYGPRVLCPMILESYMSYGLMPYGLVSYGHTVLCPTCTTANVVVYLANAKVS